MHGADRGLGAVGRAGGGGQEQKQEQLFLGRGGLFFSREWDLMPAEDDFSEC